MTATIAYSDSSVFPTELNPVRGAAFADPAQALHEARVEAVRTGSTTFVMPDEAGHRLHRLDGISGSDRGARLLVHGGTVEGAFGADSSRIGVANLSRRAPGPMNLELVTKPWMPNFLTRRTVDIGALEDDGRLFLDHAKASAAATELATANNRHVIIAPVDLADGNLLDNGYRLSLYEPPSNKAAAKHFVAGGASRVSRAVEIIGPDGAQLNKLNPAARALAGSFLVVFGAIPLVGHEIGKRMDSRGQ